MFQAENYQHISSRLALSGVNLILFLRRDVDRIKRIVNREQSEQQQHILTIICVQHSILLFCILKSALVNSTLVNWHDMHPITWQQWYVAFIGRKPHVGDKLRIVCTVRRN